MSDEIRELLARYCDLMDAGDWDGVGELFANGCLADEHGNELARGAGAVADFYRKGTILHDRSPRTKHLVLNTTISEAADGMVARSSYVVLQAVDETPLQPIITGRYVDRFERDSEGRWGFSERRFIVDLVGDLSRHLRYKT
ncbi:MAG: nuclear transport factor 2 family protein [Actinomycetota bacterium]